MTILKNKNGRQAVILLLLLLIICPISRAQLVFNKGAGIYIKPGALVKVTGNITNGTLGYIQNDGTLSIDSNFVNDGNTGGDGLYELFGNWVNNNTFSSGSSDVIMTGGLQLIAGNSATTFNNLELTGTNLKRQIVDAAVIGILNLNDKELATNDNVMMVLNPDVNAIHRTTGFVSSGYGGYLGRVTNLDQMYLFPVGSSMGTQRYRPVEITPSTNNNQTLKVRLANLDATIDGLDRNLLDSGLCEVNPLYYHLIGRDNGNDPVTLRMFYDPIQDGNWEGVANWQTLPPHLWASIGTVSQGTTGMFQHVIKQNWNNFNNEAYILKKMLVDPTISNAGPFCENNPTYNLIAATAGGSWAGNGVADPNTGLFDPSYSGPGTHLVYYTITGACGNADTAEILVHPVADIDTLKLEHESCIGADDGSIELNVSGGTPVYAFNWNNGQYYTQNIENLPPGSYTVVLTDANGCIVSADWDIDASFEECYIPHVWVPNIFSPNGDGSNDNLFVRGQGVEQIIFVIFDRWGEKIFESTDMSTGWDGTLNGMKLNSAVFVWHLEATMEGGQIIQEKGTVTLVR